MSNKTVIGKYLRVGDQLVIQVPQENRSCGYDPFPDGTKVTVEGFTEIAYGRTRSLGLEPGIYENDCWVKVVSEDGTRDTLGTHNLRFQDDELYEPRRLAYINGGRYGESKRIRDLPETPVWELDVVSVKNRPELGLEFRTTTEILEGIVPRLLVHSIDYLDLNGVYANGNPMRPYTVTSETTPGGISTSVSDDNIVLVERGRLWKYFHGEPVEFKDLRDEIDFHFQISQGVSQVRCDKTEVYTWTLEDALEAIREGLGHVIKVASKVLTGGAYMDSNNKPMVTLWKITDEDLGSRAAKETLSGFPGESDKSDTAV